MPPVMFLFVNKTSKLSLFFEQTKTFLVGEYVPDGNVNFCIFQMKHFKFGSLTLYFHWLLYLNQNMFEVELNEVRWMRSKFAVTAMTAKFLRFIISVKRKDKYGPAAHDIVHHRESAWGSVVETCYVLKAYVHKEIIGMVECTNSFINLLVPVCSLQEGKIPERLRAETTQNQSFSTFQAELFSVWDRKLV